MATAVSTHGNWQQQTGNNGMWTARLACSASMFIWYWLWRYMSVGEWNGWGRVSQIQIESNFLCTHWNFSTRHSSYAVLPLRTKWCVRLPVPVAAFQRGGGMQKLRFRCALRELQVVTNSTAVFCDTTHRQTTDLGCKTTAITKLLCWMNVITWANLSHSQRFGKPL